MRRLVALCEVSGRYRIEELESRLIRVINDLHQKTYGKYYLGELNLYHRGNYDRETLWNGVWPPFFVDFLQPEVEE